ncbi:hypothetical protein QUA03_13630 [Microcoleus sp. S36b_A4]
MCDRTQCICSPKAWNSVKSNNQLLEISASNPPTSSVPLSLEQVLKHFFCYDSLIPGQQEIVEAALQKRDMMIIMPTGSGKSLYFQ